MPRRLPLVCSVRRPASASIDSDEWVAVNNGNGNSSSSRGSRGSSSSSSSVRLRVRRLTSPLPSGCAAIAPSLRTPLTGGSPDGHHHSNSSIRDPFTEVGVTPRCLLRLQILSGSWVRVLPAAKTTTAAAAAAVVAPGEHSHALPRDGGLLCRAVAVSPTDYNDDDGNRQNGGGNGGAVGERMPLANDEVLLPPSVAFNAALGPFSGHVVLRRAHNESGIGGSRGGGGGCGGDQGACFHSPPPIARTASVSRVKRPRPTRYSGTSSASGASGSTARKARAHALALLSFFSTPRVLRVGDVFGVSLPYPGGTTSGGGDGGVGCWWQELQEEDDDDGGEVSASDEEEEEEVVDAAVAAASEGCWGVGRENTETTVPTVASIGNSSLEINGSVSGGGGGDGGGGGGAANGRTLPPPPRPRPGRRRVTAVERFTDAIVRQGSELVYFRVTELEGEVTGGGGGGGGSSSGDALLAPTDDESLKEQSGGLEAAAAAAAAAAGGMVVSQHATELREGGPVCSPVPETLHYQRFVCRANGYPCPEAKPPLDERCVEAVVAALAPLVGPEACRLVAARSRPAVLLHGPATAEGGDDLVEAAAERLGLHVRTVVMRSVLGSTPHAGGAGGAAGALRQEFQAAIEASPCVLHLRSIASLAGGGGRQAPGSEEVDEHFVESLSACLEEMDTASATAAAAAAAAFPGGRRRHDSGGGRSPLFTPSAAGAGVIEGGLVVLVGSAESLERVPASLRRCFTHEVLAPFPSERLRLSLLEHHLGGAATAECLTQEALEGLARRLLGRSATEIRSLVSKAGGEALARSFGGPDVDWLAEEEEAGCGGGSAVRGGELVLTLADLEKGEKLLPPPSSSMKMGCPKIPQVKWDDIGGLGCVKREILDIIELPLKHPEVFGKGVKRRAGILLYGPPGTGKTLLAKAVATECGLPFFSVKGPELLDMYVGESERNVREVFAQARLAAPCVLFFDELDSLAPARGRGGDSGGVMDRVVAQLLAELDGAASASASSGGDEDDGEYIDNIGQQQGGKGGESSGDGGGGGGGGTVFVIGATNRPDLLDPSLMRPGRFDRLLYLGVSGDRETQIKVLRAITRKFGFEEDAEHGVDLAEIVRDRIPPQFTGADLSAVASNALQLALRRRVAEIEAQVAETNARELYLRPVTPQQLLARLPEDELAVKVSREDLEAACLSVVPSVSEDELLHYERMRLQFSGDGGGGGGGGGGPTRGGGGGGA